MGRIFQSESDLLGGYDHDNYMDRCHPCFRKTGEVIKAINKGAGICRQCAKSRITSKTREYTACPVCGKVKVPRGFKTCSDVCGRISTSRTREAKKKLQISNR